MRLLSGIFDIMAPYIKDACEAAMAFALLRLGIGMLVRAFSGKADFL